MVDFRERAVGKLGSFGKIAVFAHFLQAVERAEVLAFETGFVAIEDVEGTGVVAEGAEGQGGAGGGVVRPGGVWVGVGGGVGFVAGGGWVMGVGRVVGGDAVCAGGVAGMAALASRRACFSISSAMPARSMPQRRSWRQRATAMFSTRAVSTQLRGSKRVLRESRRAVKRSRTSPSRTTERARRPCRVALRADLCFPSGVLGPVDFRAFSRLVLIWSSVAMGFGSFLVFYFVSFSLFSVAAFFVLLFSFVFSRNSWPRPDVDPGFGTVGQAVFACLFDSLHPTRRLRCIFAVKSFVFSEKYL